MYSTVKPESPTNGQIYFDTEKEKFFIFKNGIWNEKELRSSERIVQVLREEEWKTIDFSCVKKGERLRLFDPDGKPVRDEFGEMEWTSASKSYFVPKLNTWKIKIN
jgi:hypothetical protein